MADVEPSAGDVPTGEPAGLTPGDEAAASECNAGSTYNGSLGLRVGAIFIILVTSLFGALFPIIARRVKALHVPAIAFEFAKYFGSGVIIATAFMHLLAPAFEALGSECLSGTWTEYDFAPAIAMTSMFGVFLVEFFAFRIGMARLERMGLTLDPHANGAGNGHHHTPHEHRPVDESSAVENGENEKNGLMSDADWSKISAEEKLARQNPIAQILGVAILEFGVIVHSVIIGLTLAVTDNFTVLFIVIIFHQSFEGTGLGARLAYLPLPARLDYVPVVAAVIYACTTPLGLAIGLGVRESYDATSTTTTIVSGVLDAISAGILLYTGLVELLAHEWLYHDKMRKAPIGEVLFGLGVMLFGAGLMASLARWA